MIRKLRYIFVVSETRRVAADQTLPNDNYVGELKALLRVNVKIF